MGVGGVGGSYRPQGVVESLPIVGPIASGVQSGKSAGDVAGDVFKTILDPLGIFSGGSGPPPTMMTGSADKIAAEVAQGQGARQAASNFNYAGYNEALKTQMDQAMGGLVAQMQSGQINAQQFEALIKQKTAEVSASVNGRFGTPPPPPDAFPKPEGAFDWKGYNSAIKSQMDDRMKGAVELMTSGQINAQQLTDMSKQIAAEVTASVNGKYGTPPDIVSPNAKKPGYPYEAREAATADSMKGMMDQLMPQIMSGQLTGPALEQTIADRTKSIVADLNGRFGDLPGPTPPDPAKDTKEIYDTNRWQMEAQIQSMQENGSTPQQILGYKLQRQAELAQMFPKQSTINETREEWKSVAIQMQAAGKSEGEIKDYLKKKEEAFKDPTAEELAVYSAKKQREAAEIAALVQAANQQKTESGPHRGAQF